MRLAAIDVGTNTVRMLVSEGAEPVERGLRITRLGKGVDRTGRLETASIERTREAVAVFVARARELGAERLRVAGTSALRDATNADAFASAVRDATGIPLEVLTGTEEGRCAYAGATSWLGGGSYVVCDIGGGSTELITRTAVESVDVGSVRLRERFVPSDPPAAAEIESARRAVRDAIVPAVERLALHAEELVGVAGTITTLAALVRGLDAYDPDVVHGSRLSSQDVSAWAERLAGASVTEVRALGPVEEGRADVLVTGVIVLDEVMRATGAPSLVVSERDILDGLVLDLADRLA